MPDIQYFIKIFDDYCDRFIKNCKTANTLENINLKITHSKNVFNHCSEIAKSEKLNSEERYIAEICGLFHDIGRFEQFTVYNTFKDEDSVYHGELGVDVLKKEKILKILPTDIQEIIYTTVYNHGLIEIPANTYGQKLFFSKLVRDADKADIFRIVAHYYHSKGPRNIALEYGLEDIPMISPEVFRQFRDRQMISKESLKTLNDFKTMQLAWIFDINFNYTYKHIFENKYTDAILLSITDASKKNTLNEIIDQIFRKEIKE